MKYLDLSSNQGKINFAVLGKQDIDGIILRSTTANGKLDTRLIEYYNGILHNMSDIDEISVYKFTYAWDYVAARMECRECLNAMNEKGIHYDYFYLDLEAHGGSNYTTAEANAVILGYLDELSWRGLDNKFRLYFNYNYAKNIIDKRWAHVPVWLAHYNKTMGDVSPFNVVLWQYTSTGHVDGISTNVDISKGVNE